MKKSVVVCDKCGDEAEIKRDLRTALSWGEVQLVCIGNAAPYCIKDLCWNCLQPVLKALDIKAKKPIREAV